MPGSHSDMVMDMTDLINLRFQPGGYSIYRTGAMIDRIASEKADDGSLLLFGEYAFILILRSLARESEYGIKLISCPFIKTIPMNDTIRDHTPFLFPL